MAAKMAKKRKGGRPKGSRTARTSPQQIDQAEKKRQAMTLRRQGWSYEAIGEAIGLSRSRAFDLVDAALKEAIEERKKAADTEIEVDLQRCNEMIIGLQPAADRGEPAAVAAMLNVIQTRQRLSGFNPVTKIEQSGPNGGPIVSRVVVEDAARSFDAKAATTLEKLRKAREAKGDG